MGGKKGPPWLPLWGRGEGQTGEGQDYLSQSREKSRNRFLRNGESEIFVSPPATSLA